MIITLKFSITFSIGPMFFLDIHNMAPHKRIVFHLNVLINDSSHRLYSVQHTNNSVFGMEIFSFQFDDDAHVYVALECTCKDIYNVKKNFPLTFVVLKRGMFIFFFFCLFVFVNLFVVTPT